MKTLKTTQICEALCWL